jgi:hypothetical protein
VAPREPLRMVKRILRERGALSLLMTTAVLAWSIRYLISLGLAHTAGPEMYGVLVAALAVGGALLNLALLASSQQRLLATAGALVLWTVVAFGGFAGTVAHAIGPVPSHGPFDVRPRPVAAPLVFTVLGLAGGIALFRGYRVGSRRSHRLGEE